MKFLRFKNLEAYITDEIMGEISPEEKVIRAMEKTADLYGFNESYARIYGTLYFEDEMTLDELSEATDLSKSTVSRCMSEIEDMYLAESSKKEGHGKTKFYSAERDLESAMMKLMENEATREIEIMTEALEEAEKDFEEIGDEKNLEKVRNMKEFYSRAEKFLALMKKLPSTDSFERVFEALKNSLSGKD